MDSPERVFTAQVEASAPPTLARHEGSTRLDIPLGTGAALACFVYERPLDAAGALLAVANAVRAGPGVTVRHMEPTEVLLVPGAPALFLRVDYETSTPAGTGAGQMKLMVSASPELPLLCAHDEPGYTRTFRRITTALATSLQVPGGARKPARGEELHVMKLDGRLAGFGWRASRRIGDGSTRTEASTSLLLPSAGGGLRAEDTTTTTLTDEQDHLTELRHARAEDGALALQVTLRRERKPVAATAPAAEPGTLYRYEGREGTRAMKGTFTSKRGLATEDDVSFSVRKWLLSGERPEVVLDVYRPQENVTAPTELTLRREPKAGPRALTLTLGTRTAKARANAQGLLEWMELARPEGRLTSELIHASP
ncbi:hypothetical protein [Pyxidicoccus xibeiensis]|uniref:hypothetical protein n=1 Tax=Pyxidicoccus xibeiensis TaxID=2906759 RepID=UPI0020A6FA44|nr:hypothetical protein [Pyxidicoccus xibeiensis]MCP3139742.1 hypothetical protein [Pyxidicoccus xibeiensis]